MTMQERDPRSYQILLQQPGGACFLGSTPEQLYVRTASAVASEAVAATRPRGPPGQFAKAPPPPLCPRLPSSLSLLNAAAIVHAHTASSTDSATAIVAFEVILWYFRTLWVADCVQSSLVCVGDIQKDFWYAFDLLRSPKDHVEFTLVRDFVRDALAEVCSQVKVDTEKSVLKQAAVQHLYGRLSGQLLPDANDAQLLVRSCLLGSTTLLHALVWYKYSLSALETDKVVLGTTVQCSHNSVRGCKLEC